MSDFTDNVAIRHPIPQDFRELFQRASGSNPYAYQAQLAAGPLPDVLIVPTGAGKTNALLLSWLHQRARGDAPRRLVYALPMRTLVEQTASVAVSLRGRLGLSADELPIHVLMGGVEQSDWREHPERQQIIIGTIDMLLSRALGRGYAESRFAWPISFGLLNSDCRWVFDEVQLMGPARATSAQLDGLRAKLGTLRPCETIWASATINGCALKTIDRPHLGSALELPQEDRSGALARRLEARKVLKRVDISGVSDALAPAEIANVVRASHIPGQRTLVVLNTVARAQAVARQLARGANEAGPSVTLVHSRFRPADRQAKLTAAFAEVDPSGPGSIVVSTQVVEAGVDISSRVLISETAPFSSIVQRLGRLNRAGEHVEASFVWLDRGELEESRRGAQTASPYAPVDLNAARAALKRCDGQSLSPAMLEGMSVAESEEDPVMLRRRDLLDLFDTSPDLSGMDVDIAPFIRSDEDRTVSVFFRELGEKPASTIAADQQPAASPHELVTVPLSQLDKRSAWLFDPADERWVRRVGRELPPGSLALLDSADGGYDPVWGWDRALKGGVPPAQQPGRTLPEGIGSDPRSFKGTAQELGEHLMRAASAAKVLANELQLEQGMSEAMIQAAALHDLGKAHPVFQETLLRALADRGDPARLWAKSGSRAPIGHRRQFFRHELASALAVRALAAELGLRSASLVGYLVGAHHGRVRLSIRPAPGERRPEDVPPGVRFALGVADGDRLPEVQTPLGRTRELTLDLACMALGAEDSWARETVALRDDPALGPFRLAALEALVRVADWRAGG